MEALKTPLITPTIGFIPKWLVTHTYQPKLHTFSETATTPTIEADSKELSHSNTYLSVNSYNMYSIHYTTVFPL